MKGSRSSRMKVLVCVGSAAMVAGLAPLGLTVMSAAPAVPAEVTFTKHIAPIIQRSCENCHRPDGVAPMSLVTYEDARPWARAMKQRTGIGPKAGVMPPWYVEKNIGIQKFHNDPSLSDDEIATIAKWADSGAPRGNPADMPPPKVYADRAVWAIGTPDLIIKMKELTVKGDAPDWWGEIPSVPTGLTEDRYVAALEIKEVNDVESHAGPNRATVGGRFVVHHMIWRTQVLKGDDSDRAQDPLAIFNDEESVNWPVHEVGRNADFFDPKSARLLKAGSSVVSDSSAPLLPKGTILHIIGYMDNSPSNKNVPDPRNWQGSGNRSVANMFIDLGIRVALTDEQFQEEMAKRRERLHLTKNDVVIGCPLCNVIPPAAPAKTGQQ